MAEWTIGSESSEKRSSRQAGGIFAPLSSFRQRRRTRKSRIEALPDALRRDVGVMGAETPRRWWEFR